MRIPGDPGRRDDLEGLHPPGRLSHVLLLLGPVPGVAGAGADGGQPAGLAGPPPRAIGGGPRGGVGDAAHGAVDVGRAGPGVGGRCRQRPGFPPFRLVRRRRRHDGAGPLLRLPRRAVPRFARDSQGPHGLASQAARRRQPHRIALGTGPRRNGHGPEAGGPRSVDDPAARVAVLQAGAGGRRPDPAGGSGIPGGSSPAPGCSRSASAWRW